MKWYENRPTVRPSRNCEQIFDCKTDVKSFLIFFGSCLTVFVGKRQTFVNETVLVVLFPSARRQSAVHLMPCVRVRVCICWGVFPRWDSLEFRRKRCARSNWSGIQPQIYQVNTLDSQRRGRKKRKCWTISGACQLSSSSLRYSPSFALCLSRPMRGRNTIRRISLNACNDAINGTNTEKIVCANHIQFHFIFTLNGNALYMYLRAAAGFMGFAESKKRKKKK